MIKLAGIHKFYPAEGEGFLALKDINLDFTDDHFVCVLGKSGSGKTTLLNIIGGLDRASAGHMVIDKALTTKFTETEWDYFRNYKIGFVFQNYSLIEHLTVLENVMLSEHLQGVKREEAKKRALKALEDVKISNQAEKLPGKLSGGQRQRVAIARALVNDPEVILADEPTGNLDKKTTGQILELFKNISSDKLLIMVTHSRKIADTYADRIIELKDGSVISDTKPYLNIKAHIAKANPKITSFKLADKIRFSFKNILTKKWRSFLMAFGLSIGVIGFILINGISNGLKANLNSELLSVDNTPDYVFTLNKNVIPKVYPDAQSYLSHLLNDQNIAAVFYDKSLMLNPLSVNGSQFESGALPQEELMYRFTDNPDVQTRYFGSVYGDGHFPEKDHEIVLSQSLAQSLYNYSSLDKLWEKLKNAQIEIPSDYYDAIPLGEIMSSDRCTAYPFTDESTIPAGYNSAVYGSFASQIDEQKSLYGALITAGIEKKNSIYVCENYDFTTYKSYDSVKSTEILTVTGINTSQFVKASIITKTDYLNLQSNQGGTYKFDVYVKNPQGLDAFNFKLKYSGEAIVMDNSATIGSIPLLSVFINMVQFIILSILFVAVITSLIMLLMLLLISVMERSREIGILRSLGATRSDILSVFLSESAVLGFLAGVMGIVLSYILAFLGNLYINYRFNSLFGEGGSRINFILIKPIPVLSALIFIIVFSMIFGLIPAIAASRKTPIDALKRI